MMDQREMMFDGIAGRDELAGQGVIPVPGVDTEPHEVAYRVPVALTHLSQAVCTCGWTSGPGYIAAGNAEEAAARHRRNNRSEPHPSDGCGLCGWEGVDDPCPSHAAEVAEWDARNGYTPVTH